MMLKQILTLMLIVGSLSSLSGTLLAADFKPTMHLLVNDKQEVAHSPQEPLLIFVTISNSAILNVESRNKRNQALRERYQNSDVFKTLSKIEKDDFLKKYPVIDPPVFIIGSEEQSVLSLIRFRLVTNMGEEVALPVKPLASTLPLKQPLHLDGKSVFMGYFGIAASEMAGMEGEEYFLSAVMDSTNQKDMWKGTIASNSVRLTVISQIPSESSEMAQARLYRVGLYYRLDQNYDRLEETAQSLIKLNPNSIGGHVHLGDALAGKERDEDALDVFEKAQELYNEKFPSDDGYTEPPLYITRRMKEILGKKTP